jgi:hypothetical protein
MIGLWSSVRKQGCLFREGAVKDVRVWGINLEGKCAILVLQKKKLRARGKGNLRGREGEVPLQESRF